MRIAYYMPFKPLGHDHPSGDLITGTELYDYLHRQGHDIRPVSRLRTRWIYLKPWLWPFFLVQVAAALQRIKRQHADIWLTYHTYYKAPDILGLVCARFGRIPYIIFQGIYSTKRQRRAATWAGFILNRKVLTAADFVVTNKKKDYANLRRIIPVDRLAYVGPGIVCRNFVFDPVARKSLRKHWGCEDDKLPLVISVAMFRPGVKTRGLELVIRACARLFSEAVRFRLVVAGDGAQRKHLVSLAQDLMPNQVLFLGRVNRWELYRYFSAADIFAFPGIEESLGMVYLEAQSCGLPAVAFQDWGAGEAIEHGKTGLLSPANDLDAFAHNIRFLIEHSAARRAMGKAAAAHIRAHHDMEVNYRAVETILRGFGIGRNKLFSSPPVLPK
jgi:glycosyltransferase involved in cell wall biosynthesis